MLIYQNVLKYKLQLEWIIQLHSLPIGRGVKELNADCSHTRYTIVELLIYHCLPPLSLSSSLLLCMHCMSTIIPLTSARNAIHRTIACILSHIVVHFTLLTLAFWRSLSPPLSPSLSLSLACCCQSVPLIAAFEMHRFALETYHYHHYICYSGDHDIAAWSHVACSMV